MARAMMLAGAGMPGLPLNAGQASLQAQAAAAVPEPPPASIRAFKADDLKFTRFLLGAEAMEPSARANTAALFSTTVLPIWFVATLIGIERLGGGLPSPATLSAALEAAKAGDFGALVPTSWASWDAGVFSNPVVRWLVNSTPVLVAPPIILLAFFEFRHRGLFEDALARVLRQKDMVDIPGYYASAGAKGRTGFWVLEYDGRVIGAVGVDGRDPLAALPDAKVEAESKATATPSETPAAAEPAERYPLRARTSQRNLRATASASPAPVAREPAPKTLRIRRLATSLPFRETGIAEDLVAYAAKFAFAPSSGAADQGPSEYLAITVLEGIDADLVKTLTKVGFRPASEVPGSEELQDDEVTAGQKGFYKLLSGVWPVSLKRTTWVLSQTQWRKQ